MRPLRKNRSVNFDLLPDQYRIDQQLRATRFIWMMILGALTAVFICSAIAEAIKHRFETQRRGHLIANAFPVVALRQQILQQSLQQSSEIEFIEAVESAKPSDELLQTLAGITSKSCRADRSIEIEFIKLRLPLEYTQQASTTDQSLVPTWATGNLLISAVAKSSTEARRWTQQIKQLERINADEFKEDVPFQNLRFGSDDQNGRPPGQPVTVTTQPLCEVRLP